MFKMDSSVKRWWWPKFNGRLTTSPGMGKRWVERYFSSDSESNFDEVTIDFESRDDNFLIKTCYNDTYDESEDCELFDQKVQELQHVEVERCKKGGKYDEVKMQ